MTNPVATTIVLVIIFCTYTSASMRTCGIVSKTKEENERIDALVSEHMTTAKAISNDDEIVVNVYWHVIMKWFGSKGDISDEVIQHNIDIMNDAYAGVRSNYSECENLFSYEDFPSSPFRFELKQILRHRNTLAFFTLTPFSSWFRRRKRIGTCADLNIYTGQSFFVGFATWPDACPTNGNVECANRGDSVVINYGSVPGGHMANYDQGDTAVHEVGHWLGLMHTFDGNDCENRGDNVADTPPQSSATYGCPLTKDTCVGDGLDPVHNFMDYADDCCMYQFTQGQINRMVALAEIYRGLTRTNKTLSVARAT